MIPERCKPGAFDFVRALSVLRRIVVLDSHVSLNYPRHPRTHLNCLVRNISNKLSPFLPADRELSPVVARVHQRRLRAALLGLEHLSGLA